MANLTKKTEATLSEGVRKVLMNYTRAATYHRRDFNNCLDNYRFYFAKNPELGLGQYKLEAAQRLSKQNRQLIQYNFAGPLLDNMAGSLVQMKLEPSFIPINAEKSSLTELPQKMAASDREFMNWDNSVFDLTLGGLIHQACVKMGTSNKWDKRGNITMESMLFNSTYPDPTWRTPCSSDCKRVWHEGWFTAEQIMEIYQTKSELIKMAAERVQRDGMEFGENHGVSGMRGDIEDKWGSLYKVIEEYEVTPVKTKCVYLIRPGGTQVKIPKEVKELDMPAWLNSKYPDWQPFDIFEDVETENICTVKTICTALMAEDYLENRKTELQLGCTPFKFWSCSRLNGEPKGLLENVKDAQTYINYWSGMLTNKIQTEGGGGSQFVDPDMFKTYAEFERFCSNRNNPSENFQLKGGYMERGVSPAKPVIANSAFPNELYRNLEFVIDKILPHISKVPPVQYGVSEQGDSGYLFRQKKTQADLQAYTIHYTYKNFWNDWYESYLMACPQIYDNEGTERNFSMNGGKEHIRVNEVVELENGDYGIKNDMSKLKEIRMQVIITERPDSPTEQANNILTYSELANSMAKIPSKQASVGILLAMIADNIPFPEKDKLVMVNVNKKETELELLKLDTAILTQKSMVLQAEQQLKMLENPPPPAALPGPSINPDGTINPSPASQEPVQIPGAPSPINPEQSPTPPPEAPAPINPLNGGNNAS